MIAISGGAGLQSLLAGLRRLHQTEVRVDTFAELGGDFLRTVARSFQALTGQLVPGFFFVDDERLDISVLSPSGLRIAVTKNWQVLKEYGVDSAEARPTTDIVQSLAPGAPRSAVVYATQGCALHKTIAVPAGIRRRQLRQTLEYLLEVETPFQRENVYWGFQARPKTKAATRLVDLVVAPKSLFDPIIASLRSAGIHLREISYREGLTTEATICLARYPKPREQQRRRLAGILAALVVLQLIAIGSMPIIAQAVERSRLNEEMAKLSSVAGDLGELQSKLNGAMAPVRQAQQDLQTFPSSAAVLRILQAELGAETVLDRLSLRGAVVQASGSTPNVGLLTEHLEKSRALKPKSITRNGVAPTTQQELFSVSLELVGAKGQ